MTGAELYDARAALGEKWGLGRPVGAAALGRLIGLRGRDPGATILDWESGKVAISGPAEFAIRAMLDGYRPADWHERMTAPRLSGL